MENTLKVLRNKPDKNDVGRGVKMQNQSRDLKLTNHAYTRFVQRFSRKIKAPVRSQQDAVEFFNRSRKIAVTEDPRIWIEYYHNTQINCIFVLDKVTAEIITVFIPLDRVKYREAFLKQAG